MERITLNGLSLSAPCKKKKMEDQPSHGYRAETGRSLEAWDEEDYDYGVAMEFYNSGD